MKSNSGKSIKALRNIFSVIVILISVFIIAFSYVVDRDGKSLFGYSAFSVVSNDLGTGGFSSGDVVVTKPVSDSMLKNGDMISFVSQNEASFGKTVIRHIRSVSEEGFVTYNSVTDEDDAAIVSSEEIIGEYLFSIPKANNFFAFLKTVPGYILCVFIPVLILIIIRGMSSVSLFRKYRDEQLSEIESVKSQTSQTFFCQEPENDVPAETVPKEPEFFENEPLSAGETQIEPEIIEEPEIQKEPELPEEENADIFENDTEQEIPAPDDTAAEPSLEEMLEKLRDLRKDLDFK